MKAVRESAANHLLRTICSGSSRYQTADGPYVANALFGGPDPWPHAWIYLVGTMTGTVTYRRIVPAPMRTRRAVDGEIPANEVDDRRLERRSAGRVSRASPPR